MESKTNVQGNAIACGFAVSLCVRGCEAGPFAFPETLQHVIFAQQCGLQAFSPGVFERMQEAAGSRNGTMAQLSTTANRIAVGPRMTISITNTD